MKQFVKLAASAVLLVASTVGLTETAVTAKAATSDRYSIPNTRVIDQDGEVRKFYSDIVQGKIVAISFVFTRCTMTCPIVGYNFSVARKLLAEGSAEDMELISISTDVPYDTPARMKEWAARFGAGPGWQQISGDPHRVTSLLKTLKAFNADKEEHSDLILLVNDRQRRYKWIDGTSTPKAIVHALSHW